MQDMQSTLQQALSMPQTSPGMAPMQPEVMGQPEQMMDPVGDIQGQLDAVMQAMQQTQDPMELQQLAGVARELQLALEAVLSQPLNQGMDPGMDPFGMDPMAGGF
jgi:DNA-binding FrmR family transcriptional regulator